MTLWTRIAVASLITACTLGLWVVGIWAMGRVGLDRWQKLGNWTQPLVALLIMAVPVVAAPALGSAVLGLIARETALPSTRASIWFGLALIILWAGISVVLMLGANEGVVGRLSIVGVFLAALVSTYSTSPHRGRQERAVAGRGAPQNNKMQLTRSGHLAGGPRS